MKVIVMLLVKMVRLKKTGNEKHTVGFNTLSEYQNLLAVLLTEHKLLGPTPKSF